MKNIKNIFCILLLTSFLSNAQITLIPDTNFEQALIDLGIDTDGIINGQVLTSDINTLITLDVPNNSISDLTGIEDFLVLKNLFIFNNNLVSLDVSNLQQLRNLYANNNSSLTTVILGNKPILQQLTLTNANINTIDVTQCPSLTHLYLANTSVSLLDVSNSSSLLQLFAQNTLLTELDLSNNSNLTDVLISGCLNLNLLNVNNGNNANINSFEAQNNPNLTCIQVDDVVYSTTNWTNIDTQTSFNTNCHYDETYVPDDNFEQKLIDLGYDSVLDDYVLTANINTLTTLVISNNNMTDATGIEDFVALETLRIITSDLIDIDVSNLTQLKILNLGDNDINTLDVSNLILLEELVLSYNNLSVLDISLLTALETFVISDNNFTTIDFSNNLALKELDLSDNTIGNIDISAHVNLLDIQFENIGLTTLDISQNTLLKYVGLSNNNLTALDLSLHSDLLVLDVRNNDLSQLNVKNGNNTNIVAFFAVNNSNLTCIQVDDAVYSTSNWNNIDAQTSFNEFCPEFYTYVPDDNFEQKLIDLGHDDVLDDYVLTNNINTLTTFVIANSGITDATGIEDFVALETLRIISSALIDINVSNLTQLKILDLGNNDINTLNVSNLILLEVLTLNQNNLLTLDFSNNLALKELVLSGNTLGNIDISTHVNLEAIGFDNIGLTTLNVSQNTLLQVVTLDENSLTALDFSLHSDLIFFDVSNNDLSTLNVKNGTNINIVDIVASNNPNLTCIQVDDAVYSTANWTNIDAQTSFSENCATANINDYNLENIAIYPNPTTSNVTIEIEGNNLFKEAIVYDVLGKVILSSNNNSIDISDFSSGIYLFKIKNTKGGFVIKKIIKN